MTFEKRSPSGRFTVTWTDAWEHVEFTDLEADRGLVAIQNTELHWLFLVLGELSQTQLSIKGRKL
jgi:hypothetical protein